MLQTSVFEMISETFESDAMRGLWGYWTSMVGPADLDGTGLYPMAFHAVHRKSGVLRPRGGMTGLMDAFHSFVRHHGGEVRLEQTFERILVEGGRATGVAHRRDRAARDVRGPRELPAPGRARPAPRRGRRRS